MRAVVAIGAVAALGLTAFIACLIIGGGNAVTGSDLRVGDCIKSRPEGLLPFRMQRVDCDRPHKGEVYAVLTMPTSPQYPGEQAIHAFQDNCSSEFTRYAPNTPAGPTFDRFVISPSPESWAEGERSMVCIATTEQDRSQSIRD
jgi:hypothetical protein